jgi:DNA polymerase III epsilon subunit-like protein
MNYLFFDTETTGLPRNYNAPISDSNNWPRMVQLAWVLADDFGNVVQECDKIIFPDNYEIPEGVSAIHGITTEIARCKGVSLSSVINEFIQDGLNKSELIICHNVSFDFAILGAEAYRIGTKNIFENKKSFCTKERSTDICKIPGRFGYKWSKLQELHQFLFGENFSDAHNALNDVNATVKCFFKLKEMGLI